jgi:hypothetical protein
MRAFTAAPRTIDVENADEAHDRLAIRLDHVVGDFTVQRIAHGIELREPRARVGGVQHGAMPRVTHAHPQRFGARVQIEDGTLAAQVLAAGRPRHGAAARRQHDVGERGELLDDRFLAVAEAGLTLDLEDGRDRHAEASLELLVGVDEALAEPARELAPERRLAGAHEAHEEEIAAVQGHRGILRWPCRSCESDGAQHQPSSLRKRDPVSWSLRATFNVAGSPLSRG